MFMWITMTTAQRTMGELPPPMMSVGATGLIILMTWPTMRIRRTFGRRPFQALISMDRMQREKTFQVSKTSLSIHFMRSAMGRSFFRMLPRWEASKIETTTWCLTRGMCGISTTTIPVG